MGKDEDGSRERIEAVLDILRKQQAPLTLKQEKFCTDACVGRFLGTKGESVKKAAKHLRACLSWRDAIGVEHLMADEFSGELAEGVAYLAGHDDEARPVLVFRIKQDYLKTRSQKSYLRFLVFTLEVAISSMSRFVDQFVLLFDASLFRSASAFLSLLMGTLKIISENYPARLHKAFVIDPPSLFSYLWKGARPFVVDLWTSTAMVSSLDFENAFDEDPPFSFASAPYGHPRTSSLRFDSSTTVSAKVGRAGGGGSTSSRFSFTVSHMDSLKPWYLTRTDPSPPPPPAAAACNPSLVGLSPLNARSFSFTSPGARYAATPPHRRVAPAGNLGTKSIPSTPSSKRAPPSSRQQQPRTPRPSFLQSPAMRLFGGGKDGGQRQEQVGREAFLPLIKFYRRPYDEIVYRSKIRPPLGGLISVVSPQIIRQRRHLSHQRF